jgi:hypothetical protein
MKYIIDHYGDCTKCFFCNNDNEQGLSCNAPESEVEADECDMYESIPEKCPLRKEAITLSLSKPEASPKKCEHRGILIYRNMTPIRCWNCGELIHEFTPKPKQ